MDAIINKSKNAGLKDFVCKKLGELQIDKSYPIAATSMIKTKFGTSVLCDIQEDGEDAFSVFLPKRYADVYTEEDIAALEPHVIGLTVKRPIALSNGMTTYELEIDYCQK